MTTLTAIGGASTKIFPSTCRKNYQVTALHDSFATSSLNDRIFQKFFTIWYFFCGLLNNLSSAPVSTTEWCLCLTGPMGVSRKSSNQLNRDKGNLCSCKLERQLIHKLLNEHRAFNFLCRLA